ncbi:MAG: hypothetical protein NC181_04490 [Clostridium sp.]|nr:hypothetical protein [Clostridium sp.]MCM1444503.1 hypothetical protein [Candidatus Amulumruptor caecigallinarius]
MNNNINTPVNMPNNMYYQNPNYYQNDNRLVGGFAFPFLLGGVTGAAIAPAFWNRPTYGPRPPYGPPGVPYNTYYYGPYYR